MMSFPIDKSTWPKDSMLKPPDEEVYYVQCQECATRSFRGDVLDARECPRCGGLMTPRKGYRWNTKILK
jgi:Zn finger protein HypA/HybF involved in hydrogenase expression